MPSTAPLILGHRGSSVSAPENTMAAFRRCIADRADGFEFDVRLSADGVPVVIHDATLQRTARDMRYVSDVSANELRSIEVGSWFNRRFPNARCDSYARETIPLLAEVFELVTGMQQLLYVEMKCEPEQAVQLAAAVVQLINRYDNSAQVVVESFNLAAIQQVKLIDHRIRTAALFEPRVDRPMSLLRKLKTIDLAIEVHADELALHHALATPRVTSKARDAGLPVVVWTVDKSPWINRALKAGVRALIANDPATMLAARLKQSNE